MIKSICLVRLSALGDVIMCVPLIRTLQKAFPKARITWVIASPAFEMLEGLSGVDLLRVKKPRNLLDYYRFWRIMRSMRFDVLLATQASLRANLLYSLISAKRKIGYDTARGRDAQALFVKEQIKPQDEHTLEGFLRFATYLGCKPIIAWDLALNPADIDWARQLLSGDNPVLAINAAASKVERDWSVERYIEVINEARARWSCQVVLTGGPGAHEADLAETISRDCEVINLVGKTKPKQLLSVLSLVDCLLCPDTGPAHMASAVGTPVVGLYAVNPPHLSGPYLSQDLVVNRHPQAVKTLLGLNPKEVPWATRVHSPEAMKLITVRDVMSQLAKVFDKSL